MKSDLYTAIAQIAAERGIPRDAVLLSIQQALTSVYKKSTGSDEEVVVELDQATGEMQVVVLKTVVEVGHAIRIPRSASKTRTNTLPRRLSATSSSFIEHRRTLVESPPKQSSRSSRPEFAITSGKPCTRSTRIRKARSSAASSSAPIAAP